MLALRGLLDRTELEIGIGNKISAKTEQNIQFLCADGADRLTKGIWMPVVCSSDTEKMSPIKETVGIISVEKLSETSYFEQLFTAIENDPMSNVEVTRYGGAIAVCGHDCKIESIIFQSNTGIDNGGNDLYVYWGDCRVNGCTFDIDKEGAVANITADTYFNGCNITKDMCVGDLHQVFITNSTASMLSVGYPEIVCGIGGLAVGFIAAMLIFRKKKVAVSSTAADDEE